MVEEPGNVGVSKEVRLQACLEIIVYGGPKEDMDASVSNHHNRPRLILGKGSEAHVHSVRKGRKWSRFD